MLKAQKTLVLFSFYFRPDLCAGSFRNSTLLEAIESRRPVDIRTVVITTMPNRYKGFRQISKHYESEGNTEIYRIPIPDHESGVLDQIKAYMTYFYRGFRIAKKYNPTLVYASTSRLFTGFLGAAYARLKKAPLYLDVRDIFLDTITDLYRKSFLRYFISLPVSVIEKYTMQSAEHINLISPGFANYFFPKYPDKKYTSYSNGIDDLFLSGENQPDLPDEQMQLIVYAGNIGEGQGLHLLVPGLANTLPQFKIVIIGDGGAKQKLVECVKNFPNVLIMPPMDRTEVLKHYQKATYTLIHLNDNEAFKKVLPSKVFELAAIKKPILAGVAGYASNFISEHVSECLLFEPGDYRQAAKLINSYQPKPVDRIQFREKYSRRRINEQMSDSILKYV